MYDEFLDGNIVIEEAISAFYENATEERLSAVLEAIRERIADRLHREDEGMEDEHPSIFRK